MENALVNLDSALELPLFSKQVAEDEIDLDGIGILARGDGELGDGPVYLAGSEKVEAENEVDGGRVLPAIRSMGGARARPKATERDTGDERDGTTPDAWIVDLNAIPASRVDVLVGYVKAQFGDGRPDDVIRADLLQTGFPILDGDDVIPSITHIQRWI